MHSLLHYPRSFLKLTLIGLVLVAMPLLAGLLYGAFALDRLAADSAGAVHRAALAAHAGRSLVEDITAMDRGARQAAILGDEALLRGYFTARARYLETVGTLRGLSWDANERAMLGEIAAREAALHETLVAGGFSARTPHGWDGEFDRLVGMARRMSASAHGLIDREVAALRHQADATRRAALWLSLGSIPLVVLLVVGLSRLIAKPVRQIDQAIRRLREGELNLPVRVDGPRDLEYLGERLDWMRQGLLQADADKSRILRHLSHELKTPLAATRESVELLRDGTVGAITVAQREIVEILRDNVLRLQKLIEDLLDYRALLADRAPPSLNRVRVAEVVERVVGDHRPALLAKKLNLNFHGDALTVRADPDQLRVIVDNLLSNAIKFTPVGGAIDIRATRDAAGILLEVDDEGPGVSPRDLPRIFDAFYQGAPAVDAPLRGSGLGLSIVWELARAQGGHIAVMNAPRGGARFRLRLPAGNEGEGC